MRRLDVPEALPGCCFRCRSSNREYYVDFDLNVDSDENFPVVGAVLFCNECLQEAVNHLDENTQRDEKIEVLETALAVSNAHLTKYRDTFYDLFNSAVWADIVTFAGPDATEPTVTDESIKKSLRLVRGEEQGSSESSNDENLVGVPADESQFKLDL